MEENYALNLPGWTVGSNPYGKEFDLAARKRMIRASSNILPSLNKFSSQFGERILEVGPLFNPHIVPEKFKDKEIHYWEKDANICNWLENKYFGKKVFVRNIDIDKMVPVVGLKLFDVIIISNVFNYIDYKKFLKNTKWLLKEGGIIIIDNITNFGCPQHFSEKRPKSVYEIIKNLKNTGFELLSKKSYKYFNPKINKNMIQIIVARKK